MRGLQRREDSAKGLSLPTHPCSLPLPSPAVWERITPWDVSAIGHLRVHRDSTMCWWISDTSHLPLRDNNNISAVLSLYPTEGMVFASYILLKPYQKTWVKTLNHMKMYQFLAISTQLHKKPGYSLWLLSSIWHLPPHYNFPLTHTEPSTSTPIISSAPYIFLHLVNFPSHIIS